MAKKTEAKKDRTTCRGCRARYDTSNLTPGMPFSCRHCGEILYALGERPKEQQDKEELPFGQAAVDMGYITTAQLATALKIQREAGRTRLRLGDILVDKGYLSPRQVSSILEKQGSRIAFLIPGYEIVQKLGHGGMGAVYKGVHLASRKTVAMKILAERLAKRPEFLERFHREARVAIDLDHPNIVKGFDEGRAGDIHYFVMEYVHGKSAGRVLKKRRGFGERRAMDIIRQVTLALDYAFQRNIVHRDIKPDNIMLTREGRCKLADYGLVKHIDDIQEAGLTSEGQIMGTPNYIAPEQASGKGVIDIRSDLYSLGSSLYHMVTGRPPYEGRSASAIMGMHISAPVPDPRQTRPEISPGTAALIQKLMAKAPAERYQTPAELLQDIDAFSQRRPTRATPIASSADFRPTPTPWEAITPDVSGEADDDSALMESLGEDHAQLSRLAPMLLGIGFFILIVGLTAAMLILWEEKPEPAAEPPAAVSAQPRPELTPADPLVSQVDRQAAELYRKALPLAGEERMRCLEEIIRRYPRSHIAGIVQDELKEYKRQQQVRIAQEREAAARKRELESMRAYNKALAKLRLGPDAFTAALQAVIHDFAGTKGAASAQRRLGDYRQELAQQREEEERRRQAENAPDPGEKRKEATARFKFIQAFSKSLREMDWEQARTWAASMAADKRYPRLHPLAIDCQHDADALLTLFPAVARGLANLPKESEQALAFSPGQQIKGRILGVRSGNVDLLIKGSMRYSRPLAHLTDDEIERFFRLGNTEPKISAEIVLGLFHFARGNRDMAGKMFEKGRGDDPRRDHHLRMLSWEE